MKNYGIVTGAQPQPIEIKETKVFVATNIHEVTHEVEGEEVTEYEFNLVEYDKDEYLLNLQASVDYLTMVTEDL